MRDDLFGSTARGGNDAEKRWHDPVTLRAAVRYSLVATVLAVLAAVIAAAWHAGPGGAVLTPIVLFAAGLGAFYRTWRCWQADGPWPIWHGAGWFLLTLSVFGVAVAGGILVG